MTLVPLLSLLPAVKRLCLLLTPAWQDVRGECSSFCHFVSASGSHSYIYVRGNCKGSCSLFGASKVNEVAFGVLEQCCLEAIEASIPQDPSLLYGYLKQDDICGPSKTKQLCQVHGQASQSSNILKVTKKHSLCNGA